MSASRSPDVLQTTEMCIRDRPYMSRSGGERVKAALSVILELAELKSKMCIRDR